MLHWPLLPIVQKGHIPGKRHSEFIVPGLFRSRDENELSDAYWRKVWGNDMAGYQRCLDGLRDRDGRFARLDAGQLVKHAFGLRTAVHNRKAPAWVGRRPVLFYLYAEPERRPGDKGPVSLEERMQHRAEVTAFSDMVARDKVSVRSCAMPNYSWAGPQHPIRWSAPTRQPW